jgi:HEAT repeat protein
MEVQAPRRTLLESLADPLWSVRRAAALALHQIGDRDQALTVLLAGLASPVPHEVRSAESALVRLAPKLIDDWPRIEQALSKMERTRYTLAALKLRIWPTPEELVSALSFDTPGLDAWRQKLLQELARRLLARRPLEVRLEVARQLRHRLVSPLTQADRDRTALLCLVQIVGAENENEAFLCGLLRARSSARAALAAEALVSLRPRSENTEAVLLELTDSPDANLRANVLLALAVSPNARSIALDLVERGINDSDANVRWRGLDLLRTIDKPTTKLIELYRRLLSSADLNVHGSALKLMSQLPPDADLLPHFLAGLRHPHDFIREMAARSISGYVARFDGVVEALAPLLKSPSPAVRDAAARALWNAGPRIERVAEALVQAASARDYPASSAIAALGLSDALTPERAAVLRKVHSWSPHVLKQIDATERTSARQTIRRRRLDSCERAVPVLLDMLNEPSEEIRASVLEELDRIRPDDSTLLPHLLARLSDESDRVALAALNALSHRTVADADRAQGIALLSREQDSLRLAAAKWLGQPMLAAAAPALVARLSDPSAKMRTTCERLLEGCASALPALRELLGQVALSEQRVAARLLATLGHEARDAKAELLVAVKRRDCAIRANACRALGHMGDSSPEVLGALDLAARDRVCKVRLAATKALGVVLSTSPQA